MTTNHTAHKSDSEKRERLRQLEEIVRRLNPELTDEQFEELIVRFRQGVRFDCQLNPFWG
jgi:exonuclease VII small subunit